MKFTDFYIKEDASAVQQYDPILKSFNSISELLHSNVWDKMAFGYASDDIAEIPTKLLKIKYRQDYDNAKDEIDSKMYTYKDTWQDLPPIDVSIENGLPYIEDGYHRYYYAKLHRIPTIKSQVTIKSNPF